MGNIRSEGQSEGEEPPSAEQSGHDHQMGGQGDRNEKDSWRNGGDNGKIGERRRDAQHRHGNWPACKK